ncbi:MAG: metallophosphoesterase family protein [Anaerolineae bacterium]
MRLAILADIHGNLPALEAVLADIEQLEVDGTIVAGDFCDRPQPLEAVHAVRALGACVIRGNRENYVLAYTRQQAPEPWRTSQQWIGIRWLCELLDDEGLDYLESLPEECVYAGEGTDPIRVVHASPGSVSELLLPSHDPVAMELFRQAGLMELRYDTQADQGEVFSRFDEPVLVCAHAHIPWKRELDGRLIVNPGSVGIPINGDTRAQYALLTWEGRRWKAELRAVDYGLGPIRAAYQKSGILIIEGAFALAQLRGIETGQNVPGRLVLHCRRHATEAGIPESEAIPDAMWDEAVATFDWEAAARGVRARSSQE